MQLVLTFSVVFLCVLYASWRIYKALKGPSDPCAGCDGCTLKEKIKEKQSCTKKN